MQMPEEVLEYARLISKNFLPRVKGYGAHPDSVFKNITMQVLYIAGSGDALLPTKKNAARLKRLVPQAQIRVLEGAPHVLFGLADDIAAFIDSEKTEK
jgi:pimeloyl-ACP methyl ester carboxylesterase